MKLYFFRHGIAAARSNWVGPDADRPLTATGRYRVDRVAKTIAKMGVSVERVVTSPCLRAQQTAEIVAKRLGIIDRLEVDQLLAPGFDACALAQLFHTRPHAAALLLVGHEPDFADTISELIGGGRIRCKKAGLARVDVNPHQPMTGELIWLIPSKLLAREIKNRG